MNNVYKKINENEYIVINDKNETSIVNSNTDIENILNLENNIEYLENNIKVYNDNLKSIKQLKKERRIMKNILNIIETIFVFCVFYASMGIFSFLIVLIGTFLEKFINYNLVDKQIEYKELENKIKKETDIKNKQDLELDLKKLIKNSLYKKEELKEKLEENSKVDLNINYKDIPKVKKLIKKI